MNLTRWFFLFTVSVVIAKPVAIWAAQGPASAAASDEEDDFSPEPSPAPAPAPAPAPSQRVQEPAVSSRATSSGRGTPFFDWSKHREDQEVKHPLAEKGLLRITKDGTYLYKVKESNQRHAVAFHAGMYEPTNLSNPQSLDGERGSTFSENYSQSNNPAFMLDYEWQLWQMPLGKVGLKVGTGFYMAQGNGHFVKNNTTLTPMEVFTFVNIPLNVGAIYRLQLWHRQMLVPYGEGGGTVFGFGEFRDDNKPPKFGGALAGYFSGGLALNLTYFDALSRIQLDREYSINAIYLTAEFRQIVAITQRYDFTSNLINAGFLMEY